MSDGPSGRVAFVQALTGDLRLTLHVHALAPDGVFVPTASGARRVAATVAVGALQVTLGVHPTRCPQCGRAMRRMASLLSPVRTSGALRWVERGRGPPGLGLGCGP